jgi:uridine kinase
MSFKIKVNNEELVFEKKIRLLDLSNNNMDYIAAKVNNRVRELDYEVYYDATVQFLTLKDSCAIGQYRRSLLFLFLQAAHLVCPKIRFKLSYSISRTIFARDVFGTPVSLETCNAIDKKMLELVESNYPFEKIIVTNEEAKEVYKQYNLPDKIEILKYRPERTVHFYVSNGYKNYLFGHMVPSTGYIKKFKLRSYNPGILIAYPRSETNGEIPPFNEEPNFAKSLTESGKWAKNVRLDLVSQINDSITTPEAPNLINICEDRHNRMLVHLGDIIEGQIETTRLICIAGPSSSGKTTFANRLCDELKSRGFNPIRISLDDYYLQKEQVPVDENGDTDYEHIDALDKKLFNENMLDLLTGKEVTLPKFNFKLNQREAGRTLKVDSKDPIIVEGIHALNEEMTDLIPKSNKFKIFISPQVQLNLDYENPISLTDIRLLRRIVRDYKYRAAPAEETLSMWPSVRKGEFKWIYKTQEDADYVFDSFLPYEVCVLKKFALPLLKTIDKDSVYYPDAERLIRMIKYFKNIDTKFVPCNSLLCEFIGGSSYGV